MRRLGLTTVPRLASAVTAIRLAGSAFSPLTEEGASASGSNSFSDMLEKEKVKEKGNEAHPMLYNVPSLSARTVGREAEVTSLWQNLLSGRRCQVLVGVDGIGKSTIASEFCDAARKSGRFTCVQWFNGHHALDSQLERFFLSMRGRKEKDVLLVLDDVASPEEVAKLLPNHKSVYVIMTSSNTTVAAGPRISVAATLPLPPKAAEELTAEVDGLDAPEAVAEVLDTLGFVPLLVNLASLLMAGEVVSAPTLAKALNEKEVMKDSTLSVSNALTVLLTLALDEMSQEYPEARRQLALLSCFHVSDISDIVISTVCGDEGAQMAVIAAQLGVLSLKWEDSAFAIHPTVAAVLRHNLTDADVLTAATALKEMWPRRWRGMGSHIAYNLVWHSFALSGHFAARGVPLSEDMLACMDRSATFLAHSEARDLATAAALWHAVFVHQQAEGPPNADTVRIARECGRLMHFLRDDRAEPVLQAAHDSAVAVHGADAAEAALVMGCLGPYLDTSLAAIEKVDRSIRVLESRLASVDFVVGKEETKMLLETIFVLLVRQGQMIEEAGQTIPDALWDAVDSVRSRLGPLQK